MRRRLTISSALVALAAGLVLGLHLYPRTGADRVKHLITWDATCIDVRVGEGERFFYARSWAGVDDSAVISCEHLGPAVFYARFTTREGMTRALAASPPLEDYCIAGEEFVADELDSRELFRRMCQSMDGRLVSSGDDARAPLGSNPQRDPFAELRARPLRVPDLRRGGRCQLSPRLSPATTLPGVPAEAGLGKGPVYVVFPGIPRVLDLPPNDAEPLAKNKWRSAEILLVGEPAYDGAVLIRGRQIGGPDTIGFASDIQPDAELHLPAGRRKPWRESLRVWGDGTVRPPRGWRVAVADARIRTEGCYVFQLDGQSFSHTIAFFTELQP